MEKYFSISTEIEHATKSIEPWLLSLPADLVATRQNAQNRTIRQILGHMIDSASNNTHRIIHLQYQHSPIRFPDYANLGNNDKWIAIQNYQNEDWYQLVKLWKYIHLHICHIIRQINMEKIDQVWISAIGEKVTLDEMVTDFPRHFKLHISEIKGLAE